MRPRGAWLDGDGDAEEPEEPRHPDPAEWRVFAAPPGRPLADYGRHRRGIAEPMAARWRARGWEVQVVDERRQLPLWEHIEPAREPARMEREQRERVSGQQELPGQARLWGER